MTTVSQSVYTTGNLFMNVEETANGGKIHKNECSGGEEPHPPANSRNPQIPESSSKNACFAISKYTSKYINMDSVNANISSSSSPLLRVQSNECHSRIGCFANAS